MEKVYLDYAATAPTAPEVMAAMVETMENFYGNPSSVHAFGRSAHSRLEKARQICALSIQAAEEEIIFTSGGTESDNLAILETAFLRKAEGRHIISTRIEHPAVLKTLEFLETQGFEVTYLPVNQTGMITAEQVAAALREDTILVTIMLANNETGMRQPIEEIGKLLKVHSAYFHTDAVQAYGNEIISVEKLGVDLLSISAHKIAGPRGVGFLYVKKGLRFKNFFHGGQQEYKKRPGTENLPGIWGLKTAAEKNTEAEILLGKKPHLVFQEMILAGLMQAGIQFQINGGLENKLTHILNLWFINVPSDLLLMQLDLAGFAVSTGSACSAGNVEVSHVLTAMYGEGHPAVKESIRISFGQPTTLTEIQGFTKSLIEIVARMQK